MGRFEGRVVFVTGAARGQGRSHAVRFAEEGASVIAIDSCAPVETAAYVMPTRDDLDETAAMVEKAGGRALFSVVDVRDHDGVIAALDAGVAELGRLDVVAANAGICTLAPTWELTEQQWAETIDINLTGVWHTVKAAVPHLLQTGPGGSIVITSSIAGTKALPNAGHYAATKHGVVGLMRTLANELASRGIRVNTVNPTNVDTQMIQNERVYGLFAPSTADPTLENALPNMRGMNLLDVPWVEPIDVSNAVLWLASEEARYVTGAVLPVDAGMTAK